MRRSSGRPARSAGDEENTGRDRAGKLFARSKRGGKNQEERIDAEKIERERKREQRMWQREHLRANTIRSFAALTLVLVAALKELLGKPGTGRAFGAVRHTLLWMVPTPSPGTAPFENGPFNFVGALAMAPSGCWARLYACWYFIISFSVWAAWAQPVRNWRRALCLAKKRHIG